MRKQISKKIRFEVLKRDSFRCQYCGASAPEVVLQVDHIRPVKNGGDNDILNLITSCNSCNIGKGAREISDDAQIQKSKKQLEEIQGWRNQIEMLFKWKESLNEIKNESVMAICKYIESEIQPYTLNDCFKEEIRKHLDKYQESQILEAFEDGMKTYLKYYRNEEDRKNQIEKALSKIGGILYIKRKIEVDVFYRSFNRIIEYMHKSKIQSSGMHRGILFQTIKNKNNDIDAFENCVSEIIDCKYKKIWSMINHAKQQ